MSFGVEVGSYTQLREAVAFLKSRGVTFVDSIPPELYPGHRLLGVRAGPGRPLHPALLLHGADRLGRQAAAGRVSGARSSGAGRKPSSRSRTRTSIRCSRARSARRRGAPAEAMKFGYFTLTDNPPAYGPSRRDPNRFLLDVVEECVEAEAMGYAQRLGSRAPLRPLRHPALAHDVPGPHRQPHRSGSSSDRPRSCCRSTTRCGWSRSSTCWISLSDGRAVFSAGRGYDQGEYTPFGASFEDSRAVFDEQMEYMMAAWRQSPFEFHGRYYSTPEPLTVLPRPVQRPHPEVYVACFSKPSIELAARLRVNTIFAPFAAAMLFGSVQEAARESKRMAREAGHPDPQGHVQLFRVRRAQRRAKPTARASACCTICTASCRSSPAIAARPRRTSPTSSTSSSGSAR